ncbi:MAG TPA: hypothetical protein VF843_02100 [Streptosporangiaceae bacterium]
MPAVLFWAVGAVAALAVAAAATGCSGSGGGSGHSTAPAYLASCGTAKTAADVPVQVKIARGHASCGTAMAVEAAYATAIRSGKAPGNGGGGPVKVRGWTCQGFATPIVLRTGKASKCVRDGDEILEILPPVPSSSPSSRAS